MGQLQQLDPFLNVGLVSGLVRRDVAQQAVLLGAPLGRLAVEKGSVDPAVELVQVHGVDAVLKAAIFSLEARDGTRGVVAIADTTLDPNELASRLEYWHCPDIREKSTKALDWLNRFVKGLENNEQIQ